MVNEMKCAALTLAILALAACSANDATTTTTAAAETPPSPAAEGPDVRLPLLPPSRIGTAVAAPGTLEVDGRCLYLRGKNGTRTLPLFATFDTRWNRAAGALEIEQSTFRPGDTVTLGGGPLQTIPADLRWVQPPDPSCRGDQAFIVYSITHGTK
jgi:hypothetical protein